MIVKKVAKMQKEGGGSFGGLADYLMDVKHDNEKVREFHFTNCNGGDEYDMNIKEITTTQLVNSTAKVDKTYHLVVSFQEDENPSMETMRSIEAELVKSIGFADHQRLSVIHDNTNNLHMHIAINRVDPETLSCTKEMLRDMHILGNKAIELEEKYNLKPTNHIPKEREPVKIKDKEIHSGVQSFLSWVKTEAAAEIKDILKDESKSLEELQKTLNKYNLELRERGAGIVLSDKDRPLYVKASDVDRGLSKGNLTKRFGEFKPSRIDEPSTTKFGMKRSSLWDEYQEQTQEKRTVKKELLSTLSEKLDKAFQHLRDDYARRRGEIKNDPTLNNRVKREAYRILSEKRIE
ncbi:MAG: TraI/MobA(P) family conjugative relaxase, partial [Sulfuricurvum sp.]